MKKSRNKLYNKTDLAFHDINGIKIPLNPEWKKLLINLSGGADSALLAFIICKIIEDNNYDCKLEILTFIRMWKTRPWQYSIALNVYNWLKNRFPDIISERYLYYIPPELEHGAIGKINKTGSAGDAIISYSYSQYLQYQNNYEAVYNATTKNPTGTTHPFRVIERDNPKSTALINTDNGRYMLFPLMLTEKDWVVMQYINNNILDLYNTTRSCEGEWPDITFETYTEGQQVPECNQCFWCEERTWANKKAGNNDK